MYPGFPDGRCKEAKAESSFLISRILYFIPRTSVQSFKSQSLGTMIRSALLRSARCCASASAPKISARQFSTPFLSSVSTSRRSSVPYKAQSIRFYSAPAGLSKPEVEGRILDLLKNFDKVRVSSGDGIVTRARGSNCENVVG